MNNVIIDKIQKLLSLATSPNEHEAKLAAEKASELLIKHNLSMQDITAEAKKYGENTLINERRLPSEAIWIGTLLNKYFFVLVVKQSLGLRASRLYMVGEETNIQVAQYVFDYLMRAYKTCWEDYKTMYSAETRDKQSYYHGLTKGLADQLEVKRNAVETEMGLVVVRDPKLNEIVGKTRSYNHNANLESDHARMHGEETGKRLNIKKAIGSDTTDSGKYLEKK